MKLVGAIVSIVVGVALLVVGSLGVQTFGTAGTLVLESPKLQSAPEAYALLTDVVRVDTGLPFSDALGETTIGASSENQEALFIGLAVTAQLEEYLLGVPYDVVRDDGGQWETLSVPGIEKPKDPLKQNVWIRRSKGPSPELSFTAASGGVTTFVVMNSDVDSGVVAKLSIGYKSTTVFPLSIAAIVIGLVLIAFGFWLGFQSRRRRRRKLTTPAAAMPKPHIPPVPSPYVVPPAPAEVEGTDPKTSVTTAQKIESPESELPEPDLAEAQPGDLRLQERSRNEENK
jgi:hypothetical protein